MNKGPERYFKEFLELFEQMKHLDRWEVWSDFLAISACAISNQVDMAHREEREAQYQKTIQKYPEEDRFRIKDMFWLTCMDILENHRDFLSRVSEALQLTNRAVKQYYTPDGVSRLVAEFVNGDAKDLGSAAAQIIEEKGYVNVLDCCCGTGGLLIAFAEEMVRREIDFPDHVQFVGQDLSYTAAMACYIQLSILGCSGFVVVGDSLSRPAGTGDTLKEAWYTPMYFDKVWADRRRWHYLDQFIRLRSA